MDNTKSGTDTRERLKIQETALSNLSDAVKQHVVKNAKDLHDIQTELKALKLFLARTMPDFKQQFPEIQRKLK